MYINFFLISLLLCDWNSFISSTKIANNYFDYLLPMMKASDLYPSKDSQSSKKQTNKYVCKYYAVRLKPRNHVGLQGIPGVGGWRWSCGPGTKTLTRLGWNVRLGEEECFRQGTKNTKHSALQSLSKLMTQGMCQKE